uniref:Ketimine reductase mu-crystallin n=1 Tax=Platynereis dumerilii TaxID=6359 RepID=A0A8F3BYH7_PLADU|nr:crytallin mu [Platynereis dumerilii]
MATMTTQKVPFVFIDEHEVERLLDKRDLLVAMETAFGHFSEGPSGGVVQPVRTMVPVQDHGGFLASMPGYSQKGQALATKLVTLYPNNGKKGLPTHNGYVFVFDPSTGIIKAVVDAESVTAIRTAMASAVASKHLANPKSKVLALLGAGVQAESHYDALRILFDFEQIRIWSRGSERAEKLARKLGPKAKAFSSVQETVQGADIICTVTLATSPVLMKDWVKPGAHINAVGATRPTWQEIDPELMRHVVLYADTRDACNKESGDIIISKAQIFAEIGEVINKTKPAQWQETTLFKSVGMALEDVVATNLVYEKFKLEKSKM